MSVRIRSYSCTGASLSLTDPPLASGRQTGLECAARGSHETRGHARRRLPRPHLPRRVASARSRGRALTIEDYYKIKSVGDAQISPDGKWVAYTLTTRIEEDNTNAIETFVVPVDGSAAPRRITHEGKSVAAPRWTDDNMLQYSLNAKVNSAVFLGGDDAASRDRARMRRCSRSPSMMPNATPVSATPAPAGVLSADGKWRAQARELPRAPAAEVDRHRFREAPRRALQGPHLRLDAFPVGRPGLSDARSAHASRRGDRDHAPSTAAQPKTITSLGMRAANVAWHPNGTAIAFTADDTWQNEQAYEQPDIYTVTTRRRREAAHQRRLRVGLAVVFARRPVPAVGAHVRHRHDHREEAVARRLGRSDRVAGRRRRADQPHRVVGSRAERAALVGGFEVRLLHRREGRHHAPVPRRCPRRRAGRAGHQGRAPSQQRHLRQGDDAHRL